MEFLSQHIDQHVIEYWETLINDWFFVFAFGLLAIEFGRYAVLKRLNWQLVGDTITNYITLAFFIATSYVLFGALYVGAYFYAAQFSFFEIDINLLTIAIAIILADLVYYWEHRFMHRVNLAWATHTVHHSSPHFNISVAYRFGPLDGFFPIFFHVPLVLLGFDPFLVFFAEIMVQIYQTALHTEFFKKFPRPVEAVLNTPSHHRVHHGSNEKYLDANYAGIFILWDRLFGTFVEEDEPVVYGLVKPINTNNPFMVFLHGFWRLWEDVSTAPGIKAKITSLIAPPGGFSKTSPSPKQIS